MQRNQSKKLSRILFNGYIFDIYKKIQNHRLKFPPEACLVARRADQPLAEKIKLFLGQIFKIGFFKISLKSPVKIQILLVILFLFLPLFQLNASHQENQGEVVKIKENKKIETLSFNQEKKQGKALSKFDVIGYVIFVTPNLKSDCFKGLLFTKQFVAKALSPLAWEIGDSTLAINEFLVDRLAEAQNDIFYVQYHLQYALADDWYHLKTMSLPGMVVTTQKQVEQLASVVQAKVKETTEKKKSDNNNILPVSPVGERGNVREFFGETTEGLKIRFKTLRVHLAEVPSKISSTFSYDEEINNHKEIKSLSQNMVKAGSGFVPTIENSVIDLASTIKGLGGGFIPNLKNIFIDIKTDIRRLAKASKTLVVKLATTKKDKITPPISPPKEVPPPLQAAEDKKPIFKNVVEKIFPPRPPAPPPALPKAVIETAKKIQTEPAVNIATILNAIENTPLDLKKGLGVLGELTVQGNVSIGNKAFFDSRSGSFATAGSVSVPNGKVETKDLKVTGNVDFAGASIIGFSPQVLYSTTVQNIGSAQTQDVLQTLKVHGNTTLSGNLEVAGTASVTGAVTLSNTLAVTGNTTVGGALTITGLTTFSGGISNSGVISSSGTIAVGTSGTLNVTSTLYHGLNIGTRTGFNDGGLNIDPSGNIRTSGSYFGNNNVLISSNSAPTIVGGIKDATNLDNPLDVYVSGKYAYVANFADDSLRIIDISDPRAPVMVGGVKDATNLDGATGVHVSGKYAYVVNFNDDSLRIIDVSDPKNPAIVGGIKDATNLDGADDVYVSGKYAYVAAQNDDSLRIIDISNPTAPVIVGGVKDATNLNALRTSYVSGKYAYVPVQLDDSLRIIDVSDPKNPAIVGGIKDATNLDGIKNVYVSGKYAYVANGNDDSLRIIDVSDSTTPVIVGGVKDATNLDAAVGIYVSGKYAYVTAQNDDSLRIIDVSSSTMPFMVGGIKDATNLDSAVGVYVSGKYAYVINQNDDSLRIIDISGLDAPTASIGSLALGSGSVAENFQIHNNLYVNNALGVGIGGIFTDGMLTTASTTVANGLMIGTRASGYLDSALVIDQSGNINTSGSYFGNGTSTVFSLNRTPTNTSGTFYIDRSGNVNASGSLTTFGHILPGTNNTYDLGSQNFQWRNIFSAGSLSTSGTIAVGTASILNATSTIYHGLNIGTRTGFNDGSLTIDPSGVIHTSGSIFGNGADNVLSLNRTSTNTSGTFYIDPSGNISASGSLTTFGNLSPGTNNTYDLGSQSFQWRNIFNAGAFSTSGTMAIGVSGTAAVTSTIYHALEVSGMFNAGTLLNVGTSTPYPGFTGTIVGVGLAMQRNSDTAVAVFNIARTRGTASAQTAVQAEDPAADIRASALDSSGGSNRVVAQIRMYVDGTPGASDMPGRLSFNTTPDGGTSPLERMRINNSGEVGIGTYIASQGTGAGGSLGARLTVGRGGINIGTGTTTSTVSSTYFALSVDATNASGTFYIDPSGKISTSGSLDLKGTSNYIALGKTGTIASGTFFVSNDGNIASSGTIQSFGTAGSNANDYVCVNTVGLLSSKATACTGSSARELKDNIEDIEIEIDNILALRPRSYTRKSNGEYEIGLIADEVEPFVPSMAAYDESGKLYGVEYSQLPIYLLKVVKEQQKQIDALLTVKTDSTGDILTPKSSDLNLGGFSILNIKTLQSLNGKWSIGEDGSLIARELKTEKITVTVTDDSETASSAKIISGQTTVTIQNALVKSTSKLFITWKQNPGALWWISRQEDGWFELSLSTPAIQDIEFDYLVVSVDNQKTVPVLPNEPPSPSLTETLSGNAQTSDAESSSTSTSPEPTNELTSPDPTVEPNSESIGESVLEPVVQLPPEPTTGE